jgi:2-phosphosulfolactate phosphatase
MVYRQTAFEIRFEWGEQGVSQLAPISDAVIIVDVMSFSSAVSIAIAHNARVYPYRYKDHSAAAYAESVGAILAGPRSDGRYSLSPASLMDLSPGSRIVLPSPNGATLSLATGQTATFAGCLRNAQAVAQAALSCGPRIAVIACGERWQADNSLRPAFEDLMGAGAIISFLTGQLSPEAIAARLTFEQCQSELLSMLENCVSGRELIERGFAEDILAVSDFNADRVAPRLTAAAYFA